MGMGLLKDRLERSSRDAEPHILCDVLAKLAVERGLLAGVFLIMNIVLHLVGASLVVRPSSVLNPDHLRRCASARGQADPPRYTYRRTRRACPS